MINANHGGQCSFVLGAGGRRFESCHPDEVNQAVMSKIVTAFLFVACISHVELRISVMVFIEHRIHALD